MLAAAASACTLSTRALWVSEPNPPAAVPPSAPRLLAAACRFLVCDPPELPLESRSVCASSEAKKDVASDRDVVYRRRFFELLPHQDKHIITETCPTATGSRPESWRSVIGGASRTHLGAPPPEPCFMVLLCMAAAPRALLIPGGMSGGARGVSI